MLLLVGTLWLVVTKAVTVKIDGATRLVHTHARDVRTLLTDLGHPIRPHDTVSPKLSADLHDGLTVQFNRARPLQLTVDGHAQRIWVTARTVKAALQQANVSKLTAHKPVRISAPPETKVPLHGLAVQVNTRKEVTLVVHKQPTKVISYAGTIDDLLEEQKLRLDNDDRTSPIKTTPLTDNATVTVHFVTVRTVVEEVTTEAPEERIEDGDLMQDQTKTQTPGAAGKSEQKVKYFEADGEVLERKVISDKAITAAQPKKIVVGTKPYPADDTGLNWAALAQCESGGNPHSVSSNGSFHGLYQFMQGTWERMGGIGSPSQATPREQTYRAILLYKRSGAGQWPVCGPRLFS
jgi:resuscitation-promoting factor RpfB